MDEQHLKPFQDHFSAYSADYASFRPGYPAALFDVLARHCARRDLAWDCATGSGQAARALAPYFASVIATDASPQQIDAAQPADGVEYRVAPADSSGLPPACVDLLTVAQALHWFDIDAFFREADRVLAPAGILAVWTYEKCTVNRQVDALLAEIFREVEDCWPPERELAVNHYRDVSFPWPSLELPKFAMTVEWDAGRMLNYLRTWSASKRYQQLHHKDPVSQIAPALQGAWGDDVQVVSWPLTVMAMRR